MPSVKKRAQSQTLRIQVHVKLPKIPGVEYDAKFLDQVINHWFKTGETPAGIKVNAISWTRGGRNGRKEITPSRIESARESFQRIPQLRFSAVLSDLG